MGQEKLIEIYISVIKTPIIKIVITVIKINVISIDY